MSEETLRERLESLDFTRRRLRMPFHDPKREGWNRALEAAQEDLRDALEAGASDE